MATFTVEIKIEATDKDAVVRLLTLLKPSAVVKRLLTGETPVGHCPVCGDDTRMDDDAAEPATHISACWAAYEAAAPEVHTRQCARVFMTRVTMDGDL